MQNGEKTAFPTGINNPDYEGLTKREYFAGLAMQGELAGQYGSNGTCDSNNWNSETSLAGRAVRIADALLEELEKPTQ